MKRIYIAKKAGFCMGVRRAVSLVLKALHSGIKPIYTYGPIIHNPQTLELLEKLGVRVLKNPQEGEGGICVIRAHGITKEERKILSKKFKIFDGTCPRVLRVQKLAEKGAKEGKTVIILGDREHAEVKGILSYAQEKGIVIENEKEAEGLPSMEKALFLAQTTQNEEKFFKIAEILKKKVKNLEVVSTICKATHHRQEEVKRLARICDLLIVIGGKFSANTRRLAEIAQNQGVSTLFIESSEEVSKNILNKYKKIGITAGASTPNWLINEVVDKLREKNFLYRLLKALNFLGILYSLSFLFFFLAFLIFMKIPLTFKNLLLAFYLFFLVLGLKSLEFWKQKENLRFFYSVKYKVLQKHKKFIKFFTAFAFFLALIFSLLYHPGSSSILIGALFLEEFLFNSFAVFFLDLLIFLVFSLYFLPFVSFKFFLLICEILLFLFCLKLYLEMVYLQSDGFLPKNFYIASLNFNEKKILSRIKLLFSVGVIFSLFFFLLKEAFLGINLVILWCLMNYFFKILSQRPLGQILYLESLSLFIPVLFLASSLIYRGLNF